jgi:hypothetical protein
MAFVKEFETICKCFFHKRRDASRFAGGGCAALVNLLMQVRMILMPRDARAKRSEGSLKLFAKTSLKLFENKVETICRDIVETLCRDFAVFFTINKRINYVFDSTEKKAKGIRRPHRGWGAPDSSKNSFFYRETRVDSAGLLMLMRAAAENAREVGVYDGRSSRRLRERLKKTGSTARGRQVITVNFARASARSKPPMGRGIT